MKLSLTLFCTMLIGTQAAFAPADRAALKAAVGSCTGNYNTNAWVISCTGGCLGETPDGSCPILAASNDATGNPYGVIGSWNVSAVTNMGSSKCTLSLSLSVGHGAYRCGVLLNIYNNSRFVGSHVSHVLFLFLVVV